MPVQVRCPHCTTLSLIADEYLGVPVVCGTCKRSFWVRSPLAAPSAAGGAEPANVIAVTVRFEVGGATSTGRVRSQNEDSYLAQLLAWSGHERRGETALAIVKHLAQAMKGGVRATSRVGQGTTFIVSLPRAAAAG